MAKPPVFLERRNYRYRRIRDILRVLPLIGLVLWMVPLLWPTEGEEAITTSEALKYLFGVWAGLMLAGWLLWRRINRSPTDETARDEPW